jgi:fermentation-respiration switch protein FrsA (DUF1100 family)
MLTGICGDLRADESAKVNAAREFLKLWAAGKNDEVVARSEEKMRAAMGPQKLAQAWSMAELQYGKFVSEQAVEEIHDGELTAVRFTLQFERAMLKIRFVLTKNGQLTGLWFDAVDPIKDDRCPPYAKKDAFREEELKLRSGDYELPAILTLPTAGANELPAVVFVHGSGPHDADETIGPNKVFRDLAWGLATNGVASLRYEKRTKKYGLTAKPEELTLEWEVIDDACAAAALLRSRPEISPQRVYVLGHSMGGFAAPFIAQRDGKLAGIIMMAANARPACDLIEDQLNYLFNLDGQVSDEERIQLEAVHKATAAIRGGRPDEAGEPLLGAPNRYWADLQAKDNVAAAMRIKVPILILQGGRDYQVTRKDFDIWNAKMGERPNVTFHLFDDLNHLMIAGEGPSSPDEYGKAGFVAEKVASQITTWLRENR